MDEPNYGALYAKLSLRMGAMSVLDGADGAEPIVFRSRITAFHMY